MTTVPITVVIPHHPGYGRASTLARCVESISEQTVLPEQVVIQIDRRREGAAMTRTRGLKQVDTPWVAFIDDDDFMATDHLETLWNGVTKDHEYVFSYFTCVDRYEGLIPDDPLELFGHEFSLAEPTQTTTTILVSTELANTVGGFRTVYEGKFIPETTLRYGEDYQFTLDCIAAGGYPLHIPKRTWFWRHWDHNTSGLGV